MITLFRTWKETRENKRSIIRYKAFLLGEISNVIYEYKKSKENADSAMKKADISQEDLINIMGSLKGVDQKEIVNVLVDAIKAKKGE